MKRALLSAILALWAVPALAAVGVFPSEPTATDPIEIFLSGSCGCGMEFDPPQLAGDGRILITGTGHYIVDPPVVTPYLARFVLDPLPAGIYRIEVEIDGKPTDSLSFFVDAADPVLRFYDDQIAVSVHWKNPWGPGEGEGKPVPLTPESGYFYFFDWKNVELTVKVLDGRPVNGHFWLFIASMTTLDLEIEVTHCPHNGPPLPCITRTYLQPAGQNRNVVDTSTF